MKSSNTRKITSEGKIKLGVSSTLVVYSIIISIITRCFAFIPMLSSFGGDVSLMKSRDCFFNKSEKDFRTGVLFFMVAHISYAMLMRTAETNWRIDVMLITAMLLVFLALLEVNNVIITIALYGVVLTLSAINMYDFNIVAFIGAMLFVISDSLIGLFMIIKKNDNVSQFLIWVTYVPAQILILTSFLL